MRVEAEKNIGTRVAKAFLRCLERYPRLHHLYCPPMPQETPRNVRKAKLVGDRLDHPTEKLFVPERTGLHLLSRFLDAVRKHPVVVRRVAQPLQREQTLDVRIRQPDGTISAVILRRVELAAIDRAHDPQHPLPGVQILPLERQLLRSNTAHSDQPYSRTDGFLEGPNQLLKLVTGRQFLLFLDLFRGKVRTTSGIRRDISVLDSTLEDGAETPLQIPKSLDNPESARAGKDAQLDGMATVTARCGRRCRSSASDAHGGSP